LSEPVYIVGIDLGTTNCVVSYTRAEIRKGEKPEIRIFEIPQVTGVGTVETRDMLPAFILVPGELDVPEGALALPWKTDSRIGIGEFAKNRGEELPHRLISSAKSWLCNTMVDRHKPILPWDAPKDSTKLSPVEASAAMLSHIRDAWNYRMASDDELLCLESQDIFLTVPASFDAVARELTVKAAEMAGLSNITLLEEPQAAFYAWIEAMGEQWRDHIQKGDLILVCDIGGGTSDFSLIRVSEEDGDLALERIAVGSHLLVGGDNMDLALAYSVAGSLAKKGTRLDSWQIRALWHSCRKAKETILSASGIENYSLTILGRGSSLIGGTLKAELTANEVDQVILDGFFPICDKTARPVEQQKAGIRELGLRYESDPAITHHLAQFVSRQQSGEQGGMELPTAILFNGGVMKAAPARKRVLDVVSSWMEPGSTTAVREIESRDLDLAVARGAAYYGLTRRGEGIRIRGGLGRSYYIGVAASLPAVPGMPVPMKALCVAPFGMEEGTTATVETQAFVLVVGEPVKFDFLGSSTRHDDHIGTVVEDWEGGIEEITTLETTLEGEYGTVIPVSLEIKVTGVGTLELWCVSGEDGQRWHLEFNVREKESVGA